MFATTVNMLRPVAIIRGAIRSIAASNPNSSRALMTTSPSSFVRHSQRFSSSASKCINRTSPPSVLQSVAVNSAFKRSVSLGLSTTSKTLIAAGATTTCVFGPLVFARSYGVGSTSLFSRRVVHCAAAPPGTRIPNDYLNQKEPLIDTKELTFGMAMGLCSGFLVKKLGKMMMLVVGLGFVTLQLLSSNGYIQVNWVLIEKKFKARFDVDGDGKVTANDAKHGFRWLIGLLTTNFQFKSTFVGGFFIGFRYG